MVATPRRRRPWYRREMSAGSFAFGTTNERVSALEIVSELNGARAHPLAA